MIYDCIMFAGELDILDCRLATMEPYRVHHFIVESAADNNGQPKPLSYSENRERYQKYWHRITPLHLPALPGPGAWEREHQQRDSVMPSLEKKAKRGDWVLVADVDEIPAPELLESPRAGMLMMRNMMLTLDQALPTPQPTSVLAQWPLSSSLSTLRDNRYTMPQLVPGGWHLSWLGGPEAVQRKLAMHCHPWAETEAQISQLVPNNDMPPWCREHAPAEWRLQW